MEKNFSSTNSKLPPEPKYTFKGSLAPIHSLSFLLTSSEEKLLIGTREGKVHLWDFQTRRQQADFLTGSGACISVLVLRAGELLTHCRGEAVVHWVRAADGAWQLGSKLAAPGLSFCGAQLVSCGPGRSEAVAFPAAGEEDTLRVASPQTGETIAAIRPCKEYGNLMGLRSAGNDLLLALFETGTIAVWDVKNSSNPLTILKQAQNEEDGFAAMCIDFDTTRQQGVIGSSAASLSAFTLNSRTLENRSGPRTPIANAGVSDVTIRRDGKLVVAAGWDSRVRVFSWRGANSPKPALRPLAVLESYTGGQSLQSCCFSPAPVTEWNCGSLLAAGGTGCAVCLWDIYN